VRGRGSTCSLLCEILHYTWDMQNTRWKYFFCLNEIFSPIILPHFKSSDGLFLTKPHHSLGLLASLPFLLPPSKSSSAWGVICK
jgi:hypothetical protein